MGGDSREVLCGPKGRHQVERTAWRGGSADSQVVLGGRQVELSRLRVRSAEGEVPLVSFEWAAATDPLDERTLAAVAAGVSTRRYASTLDPVPAGVTERATSSSAVSRRFVALSTQRLQAFLERPLGELDLRVVCIDGKVFRDHCMVIALGIDAEGRKHVLGLREGATETAAVAGSLLSDLVTTGTTSEFPGRSRQSAPISTSTAHGVGQEGLPPGSSWNSTIRLSFRARWGQRRTSGSGSSFRIIWTQRRRTKWRFAHECASRQRCGRS